MIRAGLTHVLQDALEKEVAAFVGKDWGGKDKDRLERTALRKGYEPAQVQVAEARVKLALPQTRGSAEPFRSTLMPVIRSRSHQLGKMALRLAG